MDHYLFTSTLFDIEPGEDQDTNPGVYGRQLAVWLKAQLEERGYSVESVIAEGWGYCLMCSHGPFLLWVVCGNMEGKPEELEPSRIVWYCHPVAEAKVWKLLFKQPDTRLALTQLNADLRAILAAHAEITLMDENYLATRAEIIQANQTFQAAQAAQAANIRTLACKWLASVCAIPLCLLITHLSELSGAALLLTFICIATTLLYTCDLILALSKAAGWCARIARLILDTLKSLFVLLYVCLPLGISLSILYKQFIKKTLEFGGDDLFLLALSLLWMAHTWTMLRRKRPRMRNHQPPKHRPTPLHHPHS